MKKTVSKEITFILAMIIDAFAVDLLTQANLGISTLTSLSYVLSKIIPNTTLGTVNTIVQTSLLILLIIITKKPSPYYLLSYVVGAIFGIALDLFDPLISSSPNTSIITSFIYFIIGWILMSFAVALFVLSEMPNMPFDAFTKDLSKAKNIEFKTVKTSLDLIFVVLSLIFSLIFLKKIVGIGIGTLIMALFTGTIEGKMLTAIRNKFEFKTFTKVGTLFESIKAVK